MNILIAPNSFKECSDSITVSELIYNNIYSKLNLDFIKAPISDGGDGFTEVCNHYYGGEKLTYKISKPYGNSSFDCDVLYSDKSRTVYIESASVLGLKIIPTEYRNPLILSSKGLGEILKHLENEAFPIEEVVIGIGGTGTIDLGLGACSIYGLSLFDDKKEKMQVIPENFSNATKLVWEKPNLPFRITFVLDVNNPLIGEAGAIRVFGRQKGADERIIKFLESGFSNILNLLHYKGLYSPSHSLSGAGGGIPTGFNLLLNSTSITAENFILDSLDLRKQIEIADMIITGEGSFDAQSLMGKGAGIIVNEAARYGKDVVLICGKIEDKLKSSLGKNVKYLELQSYFDSKEESIINHKLGIQKACEEIIGMIKSRIS